MPPQSLSAVLALALAGVIAAGAAPANAQEPEPGEAVAGPATPSETGAPAASATPAQPAAPTPPSPAPSAGQATTAAAASPAPAPIKPEHPRRGAANGLVLQVRLPVGETFVRSFQGPQRSVDTTRSARLDGPRGVYDVPFVNSTYYVFNGFRFPGFTVGLGFGFHHFSWEVHTPCIDPSTGQQIECLGIPTTTTDGTIFQFAPAVVVPYFKSSDKQTEAYATASFAFTWGPNLTPQYDPVDVTGAGTFVQPEIEATAIGLGGSLGLGGQHFLHPNFALGVESGIYYHHLTIAAEASLEGHPLDAVPDQEGWFLGGYAALTAMVVVGE